MRKTFKYRAVLNKETKQNAEEWLGLACQLYNACLEQRIEAYRKQKVSLSAYDQHYQLPEMKKALPEFAQVGAQCLQDTVCRVDKAFKAFFRRCKTGGAPGFPRFRSRDRYDSFTLIQNGWRLEGRFLYITNVGRFKLYLSRPIEGRIKTITIRRTVTGKWFVSFSCDQVPQKILPESDKALGIDVGLSSFLTTSDGLQVDNPRHFLAAQKDLRRLQRSLSRKKKGSARRKKARLLVAKTHEKVVNQRRDFHFKTALQLVKDAGVVCVEKLAVQKMLQNRYLAKSISDVGWAQFLEILSFKAEEAGREVIFVKAAGTSQECSKCGAVVRKSLAQRVHRCPECGLIMDRDFNAALNILQRGRAGPSGGNLCVGEDGLRISNP